MFDVVKLFAFCYKGCNQFNIVEGATPTRLTLAGVNMLDDSGRHVLYFNFNNTRFYMRNGKRKKTILRVFSETKMRMRDLHHSQFISVPFTE